MESSESSQATVRREERTHESRLTQLSQTLRHEHERERRGDPRLAVAESLREGRDDEARRQNETKERKEGTAEHDEHRMDWRFGVQWEREEGL